MTILARAVSDLRLCKYGGPSIAASISVLRTGASLTWVQSSLSLPDPQVPA